VNNKKTMEDQNNNDWDWVQDIKPGIRHFEGSLQKSYINTEYICFYLTEPITFDVFCDKVLPMIRETEPYVHIHDHREFIDHFEIHLRCDGQECITPFIKLGYLPSIDLSGYKMINGTEYFNL